MGRKAKELAPLTVAKKTEAGMHFVGHVSGLALRVSGTGARSWILRMMVGGKRRDIGLGAFPEVSLAAARDTAKCLRDQVRSGIDPLAARRTAQAALKAEQASFMSFEDAAQKYISAHEKSWKNPKHVAQWKTTLKTYAFPIIGKLHVRDIGLGHILKILEPMWSEKTETARRLRGRIELVLSWAKARGYRTGDNPAQWRGNLDTLLPAPSKVSKTEHFDACEWHDAPTFMKKLRQIDTIGARALEFLILTNVRSNNARSATWAEIDLERGVWTIPAGCMKAGKEHRVPLSSAAVKLLKALPRLGEDVLLFPNNKGKPLSDMALTMIVRRMGGDFTVHGFRATFRMWAGETTAFPREVIEHAMAHQLKDKAEAAYARGDLFTKRIGLMKAWAEFLEKPVAKGKNVSFLNGGKSAA